MEAEDEKEADDESTSLFISGKTLPTNKIIGIKILGRHQP